MLDIEIKFYHRPILINVILSLFISLVVYKKRRHMMRAHVRVDGAT